MESERERERPGHVHGKPQLQFQQPFFLDRLHDNLSFVVDSAMDVGGVVADCYFVVVAAAAAAAELLSSNNIDDVVRFH
jgi:hypothetical protein